MYHLAITATNMEKEMAPHSSTPAWKIPWTEEPGGLPSLGSHRVGHDCSDLVAAAATNIFLYKFLICMVLKIKMQLIIVFFILYIATQISPYKQHLNKLIH